MLLCNLHREIAHFKITSHTLKAFPHMAWLVLSVVEFLCGEPAVTSCLAAALPSTCRDSLPPHSLAQCKGSSYLGVSPTSSVPLCISTLPKGVMLWPRVSMKPVRLGSWKTHGFHMQLGPGAAAVGCRCLSEGGCKLLQLWDDFLPEWKTCPGATNAIRFFLLDGSAMEICLVSSPLSIHT